MRRFDYSFLKDKHSNNILRLSAVISDAHARQEFRKLQYHDVFENIREKAIIDSTIGSNAIEGIITSEKRLKQISKQDVDLSHDEKEILGYKEALELIHNNHFELDVDEKLIKQLHYLIEKDVDPENAGQYKKTNNYIMEFHTDGSRSIRFVPIDKDEVPKAIEQMLYAYYSARQDAEIDSLLLCFCVVLDFLCIHPFTDGNGRVSRLLMMQLLYLAGFDIGRYISIEKRIDEYKEDYYQSLQTSSKLWHENENDYSAFLIFSLQILYRCYKDLNDSLGEISLKKAKKNERIQMVIENSIIPLSKTQIQEKLPDVSIRTIEAQLRKMLEAKTIRKIGTYKDARYIKI